jgi:hypothetical protein
MLQGQAIFYKPTNPPFVPNLLHALCLQKKQEEDIAMLGMLA